MLLQNPRLAMDMPFSSVALDAEPDGESPHVAGPVTADGEVGPCRRRPRRLLDGMVVALVRRLMRRSCLVVAGMLAAVQVGIAAIKVHVDVDKTFDFRPVRTWAWEPNPGWVMAARTPTDDPEAIQRLAEPVVMEAVIAEMSGRGMSHTIAAPDVTLKWYLLLSLGTSSQTIGQFLPPVAQWGVPPFTASTQALKVIQQGSLAIDVFSKGEIKWRGVAAAEIKPGLTQEKRAELIKVAVREIVKRYPAVKKK